MKNGLIYASIITFFVSIIIVVGYLVSENCFKASPVAPHEVTEGATKKIYSYIPHGSLIRTARTWWNRRLTTYHMKDGQWVKVSDTVYKYNYPIFGLGKRSTKKIILYESP